MVYCQYWLGSSHSRSFTHDEAVCFLMVFKVRGMGVYALWFICLFSFPGLEKLLAGGDKGKQNVKKANSNKSMNILKNDKMK